MEILSVVNLEEKVVKLIAFQDFRLGFPVLLHKCAFVGKKKKNFHYILLSWKSTAVFSPSQPLKICAGDTCLLLSVAGGEENAALTAEFTVEIHLKMWYLLLPLFLHSFGKFHALFIDEIFFGGGSLNGRQAGFCIHACLWAVKTDQDCPSWFYISLSKNRKKIFNMCKNICWHLQHAL